MDDGDDGKEGQHHGMEVVLGVRGIGYHGTLVDKEVYEEAAGDNYGVCSRVVPAPDGTIYLVGINGTCY